jgi:hypothetical protein
MNITHLNNSEFKIRLGIFSLILLLHFSVRSQNLRTELPKSYIAYHTNETMEIDGMAKEKSWNQVQWTDDFIDIEGVKKPTYRTRMKMMWDDAHFYFYIELEEPHIWGDITQRDAIIFYNNDFEIFIDPDGDTHNYYEFEMNVLNTVWDLFLTKPYRDHGLVLNNWDYKNIKTAVQIEGTLNNPKDIDKKWTVEIAIPWKSINETYDDKIIAPKGKTWRVDFSRVNWDFELIDGKYHRKKDKKTGKYLPEYNWVWSPQGVINMHEPEHWGYVYFSKKKVGEKDIFTYGKDEKIKQELYKIYRIQKNNNSKNNSWDKRLIPQSISVKGKSIPIKTEMHALGYVISLISPFTEKKLYITQDGKFVNK